MNSHMISGVQRFQMSSCSPSTPLSMLPYCINLDIGAVYMLLKNMNVQ